MDEFTVYGNNYEEALNNLERVLQTCKDMNMFLNREKCLMLMDEVIMS
jgi:hypothetical protein